MENRRSSFSSSTAINWLWGPGPQSPVYKLGWREVFLIFPCEVVGQLCCLLVAWCSVCLLHGAERSNNSTDHDSNSYSVLSAITVICTVPRSLNPVERSSFHFTDEKTKVHFPRATLSGNGRAGIPLCHGSSDWGRHMGPPVRRKAGH